MNMHPRSWRRFREVFSVREQATKANVEKRAALFHFGCMWFWRYVHRLAIGALLASAGCGKPEGTISSASVSNVPPPFPITQAQPKLRTMKLWLGPLEIEAELALTNPEVVTGMMFRKEIGEKEGMLFVFRDETRRSFWMKNVPIPLTCAYIDGEGTILEIHDMKALDESPIYSKSDKIQYVLEMKHGWFERNRIEVGTVVRTERGSLSETFFRRR